MMTHTLTLRPVTDRERALIAKEARPDLVGWGCLIVLFGPAPVWALGALGHWLGSYVGEAAAEYGQYLGWGLAAVIFLYVAAGCYRYERAYLRRARADAAAQQVQEVRVRDPRVVEVALINDNEPILCFDIGDKRLLYLQGQWIRNPWVYGAGNCNVEPVEETVNGLPGRLGFPNTEFTVTRLPNCGRVLEIRLAGEYLPPERTLDVLKPEYQFGHSELFEGELDDLGAILADQHRRRTTPGRQQGANAEE